MGLDTSHDAWHGPYSSFAEWRRAVAQAAGFPPLTEMRGFGGSLAWETSPGDKRLIPLLHHSDCDGEISPANCADIAEALSGLVIENEWLREKTAQFIDGCHRAAAAGEPLDFH